MGTVWETAIFAVHVKWLHSPPKWAQSVPSRAVNGMLRTQNSEQVHDMYIHSTDRWAVMILVEETQTHKHTHAHTHTIRPTLFPQRSEDLLHSADRGPSALKETSSHVTSTDEWAAPPHTGSDPPV